MQEVESDEEEGEMEDDDEDGQEDEDLLSAVRHPETVHHALGATVNELMSNKELDTTAKLQSLCHEVPLIGISVELRRRCSIDNSSLKMSWLVKMENRVIC